ncbi:MAG: hypothetical protein E7020_02790 [Alphaproteobacteria bacterium]|nr:hypothetical protein [Alphaproteobacteria bacterium]
MKKYLLLCTALTISSSAYAAIDCSVRPSCADLGYTQTETDCAGKFILKCPFDETAVFCGGVDGAAKCAAEGYTKNTSSLVSACLIGYTKETCPYDSSYTKCVAGSCEDSGYTYTVGALGAVCTVGYTVEYCPSDKTKYKCVESATATQCKNAGYTLTRCLTGCTTTTCPYDSNYVKCTNCPTATTCATGYYKSGADELCDCTYGHIADDRGGEGCYRCGTQSECTSTVGGSTLYKCLQCVSMSF